MGMASERERGIAHRNKKGWGGRSQSLETRQNVSAFDHLETNTFIRGYIVPSICEVPRYRAHPYAVDHRLLGERAVEARMLFLERILAARNETTIVTRNIRCARRDETMDVVLELERDFPLDGYFVLHLTNDRCEKFLRIEYLWTDNETGIEGADARGDAENDAVNGVYRCQQSMGCIRHGSSTRLATSLQKGGVFSIEVFWVLEPPRALARALAWVLVGA